MLKSHRAAIRREMAASLINRLMGQYPTVSGSEWVRWLGVKHHATLSSWMRGERSMPEKFLAKISALCAIDVSQRSYVLDELKSSMDPALLVDLITSLMSTTLLLSNLSSKEFVAHLSDKALNAGKSEKTPDIEEDQDKRETERQMLFSLKSFAPNLIRSNRLSSKKET